MPAVLTSLLFLGGSLPLAAQEPIEPDDFTLDRTEIELDDGEIQSTTGAPATSFNESHGCGQPQGVATPMTTSNASGSRAIPSGHQVRGPWGAMYGRDYTGVSSRLVYWTVPMSGGKRVRVHERALPAFQRVSANLAAEQANGRFYSIRLIGSFVWRRVGGSYRMSHHAFGTTVDINADTNPYRSGWPLPSDYTDMPKWFVDAWREAGFCWGGDWVNVKDPMHFSWMGPLATPGYGALPKPIKPKTSPAFFTKRIATLQSAFPEDFAGSQFGFADGNRDGAPDLYRFRPVGDGNSLIELARSSTNFNRCGVSRWLATGAAGAGDIKMLADFDLDSRPDLAVFDTDASPVTVRLYRFAEGYRSPDTITTAVGDGNGVEFGAADYDRDGRPDLYVIDRTGPGGNVALEIYRGPDFDQRILDQTTPIEVGSTTRLEMADAGVDGIPDLYALSMTAPIRVRIVSGASGYTEKTSDFNAGPDGETDATYGLSDYDGDSRVELLVRYPSGRVSVYQGGTQSGDYNFWFQPSSWECLAVNVPSVTGDVNGDVYSELAVGAPGENVGSAVDAGAFTVLYGSSGGVSGGSYQGFDQDTGAIAGASEAGDGLGLALAVGDLNADGHADVAVGAPLENVGSQTDAGVVDIVYGRDDRASTSGSDSVHQDLSGVKGDAEEGDRFGAALATGDFDGDLDLELAIGIPGEDLGSISNSGAISVIDGTPGGIGGSDRLWDQMTSGVKGAAETGDGFGSALATGDFDRDGRADLAVGIPGENRGGSVDSGAVAVFYGSPGGLTTSGDQLWDQDDAGVKGQAEAGDRFGAALTTGDFNGDGFMDLAIGVPGENNAAGAVQVLFGSSDGLTASDQLLDRGASAQQESELGAALAAGDFNADGFDELAAGSPEATAEGAGRAGLLTVWHGGSGGLGTPEDWHQGNDGVASSPEPGDRFGISVWASNFDGDPYTDLAVGIPFEDVGSEPNAGAVLVLFGSGDGLSTGGAEGWSQTSNGVDAYSEAGDQWGWLPAA